MVMQYKQTLVVDTTSSLPLAADDGQLAYVQDLQVTLYFKASESLWKPLGRSAVMKGSVTVDGKTTGQTTLFTLAPNSLKFYPTQIIVRGVSITGVTIKPTFSVGSNASTYDDIATGSLLNSVTNLLGINTAPQNASTSPALAAGTVVKANVSIAAAATSYSFKVDILGYYES